MTPDNTISTSLPVSILERLLPSLAFAVAAISGAIGGAMLIQFFNGLRESENAGYQAFFGGTAEVELVVGLILGFAVLLCALGFVVSVVRLFTTNSTASPPALLFLLGGLASTLPPLALHYALNLAKGVVLSPVAEEGGVTAVAQTVATVSWLAIGSGGVFALGLLASAFVPFVARAGKRRRRS